MQAIREIIESAQTIALSVRSLGCRERIVIEISSSMFDAVNSYLNEKCGGYGGDPSCNVIRMSYGPGVEFRRRGLRCVECGEAPSVRCHALSGSGQCVPCEVDE